MTQEIVLVEQKPAEIVVGGRDAAKELTKIVGSRKRKLVLAGKTYLFFEDWQTIGKFYGVTAKVTHTEELKEGDALIGFMAQAVAVASGIEISAADAECTYDEPNWKNKPRFQLRSMSQTRACAKALRNCLGWVAVLAGYEPTPAEEMSSDEPKPVKVPEPSKKQESGPIPPAPKTSEPLANIEAPATISQEEEQKPELDFDKDLLLDSLKKVKWTDSTVKSYLKNVYKVDTEGSVVKVVARLTREQREAFFKELQNRLEMA